jgi:AraC family transcriptional regulator of adaptative response/methylated-DNA-[protein]-cysteine methyltransferase
MMLWMNVQTNDERRWQACLEKDSTFDGQFVLAVRTTGIYCRPACPARTPKRENVTFFALPHLAQQAGFRACKRCHPDAQTIDDPQLILVSELCRHIEANAGETLTLQSLGECFHLSPAHLQRVFKGVAGVSPQDYTEACRMNQLKSALRSGMTVSAATYEAGFGSGSRVYEKAAPQLGMTPRSYQQAGDGQRIAFTVALCALGQVLVAATERGICAVKLGDDAGALEAILRREFSAAEISRDDAAHRDWVQAVLGFIAGSTPHLDLPLDVRATAFQKQVWDALRRIPYGETLSYAGVAEAIGQPKAVRAVAQACGANPTALIVPCHRVIAKNGSLGGYHWGAERKRRLLQQEAQTAGGSMQLKQEGIRFE